MIAVSIFHRYTMYTHEKYTYFDFINSTSVSRQESKSHTARELGGFIRIDFTW